MHRHEPSPSEDARAFDVLTMVRAGVDDRFVGVSEGLQTPLIFCEIFPPDDFLLYFYRSPKAPDLDIEPSDLDLGAIATAVGGGTPHDVGHGEGVEVPPVPVEVVNGLGAGDAFGGAVCHGLLAVWDLRRTISFDNAAGAHVAGEQALTRLREVNDA
ncbi:PfkB family carbohydrate kinase [Actinomadura rudentiformis]